MRKVSDKIKEKEKVEVKKRNTVVPSDLDSTESLKVSCSL